MGFAGTVGAIDRSNFCILEIVRGIADTIGDVLNRFLGICNSCLELIDVLEVGSPGLDRQLRKPFHFKKTMGEKIKVTVRDENGKTVCHTGILGGYDENTGEVILQTDDGNMTFIAGKCRRIALDA